MKFFEKDVPNSECNLQVSDDDLMNDLTMMNVSVSCCEIYQDKRIRNHWS